MEAEAWPCSLDLPQAQNERRADLPYAIYTIPRRRRSVGSTTRSPQGIPRRVGRAYDRDNARGEIDRRRQRADQTRLRSESRKLLGVHIIGEGASELLHIGMMVMQFGGTINAFIDCVFNFPTVSEAYKYAAYDGLGMINRKRTVEQELI